MGRERLAMTVEELDAFLAEERVLRMATIDEDGWPAVVPVWFVWHGGAIWVWNLDRAARTRRLDAGDTRMSVVVDGGEAYQELRGVHARVDYRFVADDDAPLEVRTNFNRKYFGGDDPVGHLDDHTWMELTPRTVRSWDFRKVM